MFNIKHNIFDMTYINKVRLRPVNETRDTHGTVVLFPQDATSTGGSRMETPPPTYDEALVISQSTNTPLPLYIALPSAAAVSAATNGNGNGEGEGNAPFFKIKIFPQFPRFCKGLKYMTSALTCVEKQTKYGRLRECYGLNQSRIQARRGEG